MIVVKKHTLPPFARWISATPGRVITGSFLLVILVGTLLLLLPIASRSGQSVGLLRALFTATSAVCVTGLVVVPTELHWTLFGQLTIISLIQIGGLGLVTITTFFYTFLRRKVSLKTMVVAQESTANYTFVDVFRFVRKIIFFTLIVEGTGSIVLVLRYARYFPLDTAIRRGVFQAISAFCNAGFDLLGTVQDPYQSLTRYNGDPVILLTTAFLIIFGGLGFVVWSDLLVFHRERKLFFHSKVAIVGSGILLLFGTLFFLGAEWFNVQGDSVTLGSLAPEQRVLAAFFQSVTPRTAGFNSIDQLSMTDASKFVTTVLMFIGACPGSTGGGIKISTLAVVLASICSDIRGREQIALANHRVSRETFSRALAITGLAMGIVMLATLAICLIENIGSPDVSFHFIDVLYEATSAFGTVGLTSVGTPNLHPASWMVLIPAMYLGRVGPASFAIVLLMRRPGAQEPVRPEGRVLVG